MWRARTRLAMYRYKAERGEKKILNRQIEGEKENLNVQQFE